MKGAIFAGFSEFVELEFGLTTWLQVVENCNLPSNGEYLTPEIYDDAEFVALASELSTLVNVAPEDLYRRFGQFFFPVLMGIAFKHIEHIDNLFDFLIAVDNIIHIEVKKADPLAFTPTLLYDKPQDNVLVFLYVSHRKMCHFAEGLILGAADHYNQTVSLSQSLCLCKGDEHCLIRIEA